MIDMAKIKINFKNNQDNITNKTTSLYPDLPFQGIKGTIYRIEENEDSDCYDLRIDGQGERHNKADVKARGADHKVDQKADRRLERPKTVNGVGSRKQEREDKE